MIGVTQLLSGPLRAAGIVESRLTFHLDPGNTDSYSGSGTTWTDMVTSTNGTIPATWTYNSSDGGTFSTGTAAGPNYGFNSTWLPATSGSYQDEITYEAWISIDDVSTAYNGVISTAESTTDLGMSIVTNNGGRWSGMLQRNGQSSMSYMYATWNGDGGTTSQAPDTNNKWYHVVLAANNSGHRYYVNNVEGAISWGQGNASNANYFGIQDTSLSTNDQTLGVGRLYASSTSTSFSLKGKFGPVRIYQKMLSADEVNQNYEVEKARFGY